MKTFNTILMGLILSLVSAKASAYEMGFVAGLRQTDVDAPSGASTDSDTGFQLGVLGLMEWGSGTYFRSGAIYTQRKFEAKADPLELEVEIDYLDVPLTVLYMANESFGFFGGLELGLQVGDSCDSNAGSCDLDEVKSLIYGLSLGGHFRFVPNMGLELSYTMGLSDVWGDDSDSTFEKASGLAASFLYLF